MLARETWTLQCNMFHPVYEQFHQYDHSDSDGYQFPIQGILC